MSPRRGVTLIVVMAAIAACVVISVAFLHGEASALRIAENASATGRAREAAESGMAAALSDLQSPSWAGVGTVHSAEVGRNGSGVWSYRAMASAVAGDGTAAGALVAAMRLKITSIGTWQATGSPRPVDRKLEAVIELVPRLPATGTPNDRKPDASFDPIQVYAVFADNPTISIKLPPQTQIAGDVWACDAADLYDDVQWSPAVRGRVGSERPQPITGRLSIYESASSSDAANLNALLGSGNWSQTSTPWALPNLNLTQFAPSQAYQLYRGGPTYHSVAVGANLSGTSSNPLVLRPTDDNPLGVFYRAGDVRLKDYVRVTGTLVATGNVTFEGPGIEVSAVRPATGESSVTLPALLAGGVGIAKEATVSINGLVYAKTGVGREAVDRHAGTSVAINGGVATAVFYVDTPPMWAALSASDWDNRHSSCVPATRPILPWLADPSSWPSPSWPPSYSQHGLSNQPTFTVTRPADASYVLSPPLFRPDPSAWDAGGGYRWKVVAWSEVQ